MRFGVLGPLAVWTDAGTPVTVPGTLVRALLADLLVHEGGTVPSDTLLDDLWGDGQPGNPMGTLSAKASQLRRAFENAEPGGRRLVEARPPGYRLIAADVDALHFQRLLAARAAPAERAAQLTEALGLWRGPAYADFADESFTRATIARLEELRLTAHEELAETRLDLGHHPDLVAPLAELLAAHPLRERLRAAHMRALYGSGRQAEALESFAAHRELVAVELGLDPGPELLDLHAEILAGDPGLRRPARANNLPVPMTTLIGRDELLGALRPRLTADRLVTLVGPGGVGKTRLAVAAARDSTLDTWFVDLTRLDTAASIDDLAELVLTVLDLRDSTARTPLDRLVDALRPRALLLLLDNCEHVIDAAAELAAVLLADGTAVRVLTTSREPLNLPGETIWDVPPLSVPAREPVLADLPDVPSVRLFVERAAAGSRGFALNEENAHQVATLCRRLDGIPLALELAAGRVRALGVTGLVSRLDDRLRLLASAHRGTPPRQQTLHSVIDWSWHLLTGEEQRFLRRMSVPVGGFTPETASAVAGTPALDLLAQLVDRSLVVMEETADGPRFRLLESVSAYCAERLEEAGETALVRDHHLDHFLSLAESAAHALYGHTDPARLRALDAESANFHAAFDHAAGSRALRLANALTWYRFLRGRLTEARRALGTALADPALPHDTARATAITWEAVLTVVQGDQAGWDAHRDRALSAWTGLEGVPERATALWLLAYAGVDTGDLAGTEKLLDGAVAGARAAADPWGEAAALVVKAKIHHVSGELEALEHCATEAAVLFGDDPWGRLQANEWLGALAEMTGDHDRALALTLEGLEFARELRLWPEVAGRLAWHAWISLQLERFEEAAESAAEALRLAEEQDHHGTIIFAEICLAFAARRAGDLTVAEHHLGRLLAAVPASESVPLYQPMVLCELGYVAELRGDPKRALDLHFNAYEVGRSITATRDLAGVIEGMAAALTTLSRPEDAARLLGTAGITRRDAGLPASPAERLDLSRTVAAARAALGETAYETALTEGESLSFEAAVQLADKARQ